MDVRMEFQKMVRQKQSFDYFKLVWKHNSTLTLRFQQNADIESEAVETSKKIDIQVASLKTLLESLKLETVRYLAACIFTCLAIALGFYRFWK